ncbi:uncharacterized protein LOC110696168 [Chenopodium quinoa]|uniref:uncharacterized protein LOC110696168 n=1 Tax=Chenopodium quinoa TaxID=63459 RepID=UPI000B7735AF|nr:uncharacterized protein LOC110696168 [Chenopodium quinoa]
MGVLCGVNGSPFYKQQPVFTIKMETGEEIDCVDFYKQPTFINSSIKSHMPKSASIVSTGYGGRKFHGVGAAVSLYQSTVFGKQWSASRMKVSNGPDIIEAGVMVNPSVFNNTKAHLYIRFKAGANGCFNFDCKGFVQLQHTRY